MAQDSQMTPYLVDLVHDQVPSRPGSVFHRKEDVTVEPVSIGMAAVPGLEERTDGLLSYEV